MSNGRQDGGPLVISGAGGGGQPPDRRQDKFTGHYAPDVGPFQPLTGIKMAGPGPVRRPFLPPLPSSSQGPQQPMPRGRPRSHSAPMLPMSRAPAPFVAALDGQSVVGPMLGTIPAELHSKIESLMSITDRGALGGMRRMGAPLRVDANGHPLGIPENSLNHIAPDTPIHLYGHGVFTGESVHHPKPVFGNLSPKELSDQLIRAGLPPNYRGTLYANGCYTGVGGPNSFAFRLGRRLSREGRYPQVRANRGTAHHFRDGTTGVLPLDRAEEHAERTGAIANEMVELVMESLQPRTIPERQQQITERQRELTQQSTQIEHDFYQRDSSVFVQFPPILPVQNRRRSFSGDLQNLIASPPPPRRRNSIGGTLAPVGIGPQPPLAPFNPPPPPQPNAVSGSRPRSKSFSGLPSMEKRSSRD